MPEGQLAIRPFGGEDGGFDSHTLPPYLSFLQELGGSRGSKRQQ